MRSYQLSAVSFPVLYLVTGSYDVSGSQCEECALGLCRCLNVLFGLVLLGLSAWQRFVLQVEKVDLQHTRSTAVCGKVLTVQVEAVYRLPQCEHFFHMQL